MAGGVQYWPTLTTDDFTDVDLAKSIAVLPVAAIEQHGPHLPLEVDAVINDAILTAALAEVPEALSVLVLPAQVIGYSEEHTSFPGTLTFSAETLLATWREIGESVARAGVRKLVIFNSHGGQNELMAVVARQLRVSAGLFVATAGWSQLATYDDLVTPEERQFGIHGGALETSLMLHIAPEKVRNDRIRNFPSTGQQVADSSTHLAPTGRNAYGWMTEDLNETGAVGDATQATSALGEEILHRAAKGLVEYLEDVDRVTAQSS
ncbi:MAG TPA: creatininase [Rhodospirillaceae bacterium]|nr:creatininase [Rhodospirillaceae bacterium]HAA91124.1 creatininase [Rhodospirillaceae bacterium]HAT34881.1 creatininase [Rhodospirillaceae bacterium]